MMEFQREIRAHLATKNIHVGDKYEEFIYTGMILSELFDHNAQEKSIRVDYLTGTLEEYDSDFNLLFSEKNSSEDFYKEKYEGLEEDKVLKKWFEDNLRMKGGFYYIELNGKIYSLIFIDYINARNIVAISSLVPKITKRLVSKEQRAAKLEFLRGLVQKNQSSEIQTFLKEHTDIDFDKLREEKKRNDLFKCIKHANKIRRRNAQDEIKRKKERAATLLEDYNILMNTISELQYSLFAKEEDEISEGLQLLIDFLCSNPLIDIREVRENKIRYDVLTTISNYDLDIFKMHYNDVRKHMYLDIPQDAREDMMELLRLIFIERKFEVPCSASFELTIDNSSSMNPIRNYESELRERYPKYVPQPHSVVHNCYGNFPPLWNEALENGDYLNAVFISMSLAQNMNWSDGTVSRWLVNKLYEKKYIKAADGKMYTGKSLIKKKREEGEWNV